MQHKLLRCNKACLDWKLLPNCQWIIGLAVFEGEVFIRMEQECCGIILAPFKPLKVSLIAMFAGGLPTLNQTCLFTESKYEPRLMPLYVKSNSLNAVVAQCEFGGGYSFGINFSIRRLQSLIELEKEVIGDSGHSEERMERY